MNWYEYGRSNLLINLEHVLSITVNRIDASKLDLEFVGHLTTYLEFDDEQECCEQYQIIRWRLLNDEKRYQYESDMINADIKGGY